MLDIRALIEKLPLYQHFLSVSNQKQQEMVSYHLEKCIPLLDHTYKAFPTYTLHNIQHQVNILRIIGEILGNDVQYLTPLESALIILSAFYHDIGMVFNDQELINLTTEDSFKEFIETNYNAKLKFEKNKQQLSLEIAEWYCRWMHARRVWNFLKDDELEWGRISIRKVLGEICESHNEPASNLANDSRFETDFQKQADTRLCALLLRLADILDFDNTRSPQSVYEFLGLNKPKNHLEQVSRKEWEKHLASEGFLITNRKGIIELFYSAGPKHPEVEKTIQKFLDVIEQEIAACNLLFPKCSNKWRDYKVSPAIDRKDIRSQNYKKGNYRLSLDEKQIITLLAGENLYKSSFEFIRELIQNAIDTSRMREFHEHYLGNNNFKSQPIEITCWIDGEGFRWVRIDDNGMGLNEYIIEKHLLKKGNSFYGSSYFKLLQHQYQQKLGHALTPISRFGIGLLSCFLLGDNIEIISKAIELSAVNQPQQSVRLSITGIDGDYILQTASEKHQPIVFPSQNGPKTGFRKDFGTSVAVRIKGNEDFIGFEEKLGEAINQYITCSPIGIYYNGVKVGVDFDQALKQPLCLSQKVYFTNLEKEKLSIGLGIKIKGDVGIEIMPIDITRYSANPNLLGQLCAIKLIHNDKIFNDENIEWSFYVSVDDDHRLDISRKFKCEKTNNLAEKLYHVNLKEIIPNAFSNELISKIFNRHKGSYYYHNNIIGDLKIIHNGINIPNEKSSETADGIFIRNFHTSGKYGYSLKRSGIFGLIYLQDELIPELTVSRNEIKKIGFNIFSNLYYASQELNNDKGFNFRFDYFRGNHDRFNFQEILEDENVKNGLWDDTPIVQTKENNKSINQLKNEVKNFPIEISYSRNKPFLSNLTSVLLSTNFKLQYIFTDDFEFSKLKITGVKLAQEHTYQPKNIRPLIFLDFDTAQIVAHNGLINTRHWLTQWLLSNQIDLYEKFESLLIQLISSILHDNISLVNTILDHLRKCSSLNIPNTKLTVNDFSPNGKSRNMSNFLRNN
jgi:hypothetical protein